MKKTILSLSTSLALSLAFCSLFATSANAMTAIGVGIQGAQTNCNIETLGTGVISNCSFNDNGTVLCSCCQ